MKWRIINKQPGLEESEDRLHLCQFRHNDRPIRQQYDKEHLSHRVSEKQIEPEWDRRCPELLRFECADLYVVKCRHEVGGDLCRLLFRYGVRKILFISVKD